MKAYELLFIVAPSTDEETRANTMNRIQGVITSAEGSVDNVDEWGKRKLAYPIKDETDGYYVLINFSSEVDFPAELDRVYKITDGILRTLIIAQGE